jgi:hypothetical protein
VTLVAASAQLASECAAAADQLGFAVPCPSQVPSVDGHAMACPEPVGQNTTPCVGREGLAGYPVFALDFSGFDVPDGYVGIDGNASGHVFIEARRQSDSPQQPCIGATHSGTVVAGRWNTIAYRCSNDSLAVQRAATHGEGAYQGHTLLTWDQGGIDYIASAHGQTAPNRDLLVRLVQSMTLIPPTKP